MFKIIDKFFASDVENEYKHLNILKNVLALSLEVLLHKHVLATTIPQC